MNIPYIGEVGTGTLLAALIVLVLFYIWIVKPKLLKKKTKKYVGMGLVIMLAGLYMTNSLYILGAPQTVAIGGRMTPDSAPALFVKSQASNYYKVLDARQVYMTDAAFTQHGLGAIVFAGGPQGVTLYPNSIITNGGTAPQLLQVIRAISVPAGTESGLMVPPGTRLFNVVAPQWTLAAPSTAGNYYYVQYWALSKLDNNNIDAVAIGVQKLTVTGGSSCTTPSEQRKCNELGQICVWNVVDCKFDCATCSVGNSCNAGSCVAGDDDKPECGDGICLTDPSLGQETCENCESDCGVCTTTCNNNGECNDGETSVNCPNDCYKEPTCQEQDVQSYQCQNGNSFILHQTANCTPVYQQAEVCTKGCDPLTGMCNGGTNETQKSCSQLGGVVYNTTEKVCSKDLSWYAATKDSKCCNSDNLKWKTQANYDNIIIIAICIVAILVGLWILSMLFGGSSSSGKGGSSMYKDMANDY